MTGNFTNICYTLAYRHQLYQCYLGLNKTTMVNEKPVFGPGNTFIANSY